MDEGPLAAAQSDVCRLCGQRSARICIQRVLHRYDVGYYQCPNCDLIQTQRPFWLDEAYSSALALLDTGAIERTGICIELALCLCGLLRVEADSPCLDYGGGHGILTRAMRDAGYNFQWSDKYAQNLFARGFEAQPQRRHALLTSFEVWEHLPDVGRDLEAFFAPGHDALLIGTFLHRGHRPDWWYYSPQTGQHVAFFSQRTMSFIARRFGYETIAAQRYTLFYRPKLLGGWRRALAATILRRSKPARNSRWAWLALAARARYPRRTWDDHQILLHRQTMKAAQPLAQVGQGEPPRQPQLGRGLALPPLLHTGETRAA